MDRISLTDGLDDPTARPKVDILVPGRRIVQNASTAGLAFQARLDASGTLGRPAFGAASAARRGDTGGSFTLAGTAAALQLEKLVASVRAAGARGPEPAATPTPPATIDAAHLELARRLAAHSPAAGAPGTDHPTIHPLSELSAAGELLGAVEISASVDADPFQLDVSGSTGLNVDLMLGVKSTASALLRLTGGWTVFPRNRGTTQGIDYQLGTLSGSFVTTGVGSGSGGHDVVWQYQALRQVGTGTGTVFVRILTDTAQTARSPEFDAWYTWTGDPLQGTLKVFRTDAGGLATRAAHFVLEIPDPPTTPPVLEIDLTQDPAVLDPTEQHHVLAESALQVLAALLGNGADWQRATEAALFPRPPAGTDVTVIGERDWVLFARRRLSTCAEQVVTPKQANRHYHLYVHEAQGDREAMDWFKALLSPGASLQDAQFLGFVDFDATTADPVDAAGLRTELDPVKGDALRWVAVASDYGDGVAEEGRRRAHLESTASPVLDVTTASPVDLGTLPAVFQGRIDGGQTVHGAIVLVTVPQRAVANVYAVPAELADIVLLQTQPDGTVVVRDPPDMGRLASRLKFLLGSVGFKNGTPDDTQLQTVVAKWQAQQGFLSQAVVVTRQASDDGAARTELETVVGAVKPPAGVQVWQSHVASAQDFDAGPAGVNAMVFLVQSQVILLRADRPAGGGGRRRRGRGGWGGGRWGGRGRRRWWRAGTRSAGTRGAGTHSAGSRRRWRAGGEHPLAWPSRRRPCRAGLPRPARRARRGEAAPGERAPRRGARPREALPTAGQEPPVRSARRRPREPAGAPQVLAERRRGPGPGRPHPDRGRRPGAGSGGPRAVEERGSRGGWNGPRTAGVGGESGGGSRGGGRPRRGVPLPAAEGVRPRPTGGEDELRPHRLRLRTHRRNPRALAGGAGLRLDRPGASGRGQSRALDRRAGGAGPGRSAPGFLLERRALDPGELDPARIGAQPPEIAGRLAGAAAAYDLSAPFTAAAGWNPLWLAAGALAAALDGVLRDPQAGTFMAGPQAQPAARHAVAAGPAAAAASLVATPWGPLSHAEAEARARAEDRVPFGLARDRVPFGLYTVTLVELGGNHPALIRTVRRALGAGEGRARSAMRDLPLVLVDHASRTYADDLVSRLAGFGARAEVS